MKRLKTISIISLFCCFTTVLVNAQTTDKRLWGMWMLDALELTLGDRTTQRYPVSNLLANKNLLPVNMFTIIHFFDDVVEVDIRYAELEFPSEDEKSLKGTFATNNDQLTIILSEKQPRSFTYIIENERFVMKFTLAGVQFSLVYKLVTKIN